MKKIQKSYKPRNVSAKNPKASCPVVDLAELNRVAQEINREYVEDSQKKKSEEAAIEESSHSTISVINERGPVSDDLTAEAKVEEVITKFLNTVEKSPVEHPTVYSFNVEKVNVEPAFDAPLSEPDAMKEEVSSEKVIMDEVLEEDLKRVGYSSTEISQVEKKRKIKATPPFRWSTHQTRVDSKTEVNQDMEQIAKNVKMNSGKPPLNPKKDAKMESLKAGGH